MPTLNVVENLGQMHRAVMRYQNIFFSTESLKVNGKNKIHPTNEKTVPSSSLCVCFFQ